MKRGKLMEYKGRTLYREGKGNILIQHEDGRQGYATSVKAAKAAIDEKERVAGK